MSVEFLRPKRTLPGIDMAPLIDCVFQLLIFFMLTSAFTKPALKVALPTASSREAVEPDQIVVSIDDAEQVYVNQSPVALDRLGAELRRQLATHERQQINIHGDANIRYQVFVQVMDIARQAGAKQLNIVHDQAEKHGQ